MKLTYGEQVMVACIGYLIVILVPIFMYDWWLRKQKKENKEWYATYVEPNQSGLVMG